MRYLFFIFIYTVLKKDKLNFIWKIFVNVIKVTIKLKKKLLFKKQKTI